MPKGPRHPTSTIRKRAASHRAGKPDRKETVYEVNIKYPNPDQSTGWKYRSKSFESKADAQAWETETLETLRKNPNYRPPTDVTLAEWMDRWLNEVAIHRVRATTFPSYRDMAKHLQRELGTVPLKRLTPGDLQRLYHTLALQGKSNRTVQYVHVVAKMALKTAVEWGLIPSNPALAAQAPKVQPAPLIGITEAQLDAYLTLVEQDRLRALWHFIAITGCRVSEALGLTWNAVDWDRKVVYIRRGYTMEGGKMLETDPKSRAGGRAIAVDDDLLEVLRTHQQRQAEERERAGAAWQGDTHQAVFTTAKGTRLWLSNVRRRNNTLYARAGIHQTKRLHALRHAMATHWLMAGVPVKVVSERLGHANVAITLQIYHDVLPDMQANAAQDMAQRRRQRTSNPPTEPGSSEPSR